MVWICLAVLAALLIKLGALSVWVGVLSAALTTSLVLLVGVVLYVVWCQFIRRKN